MRLTLWVGEPGDWPKGAGVALLNIAAPVCGDAAGAEGGTLRGDEGGTDPCWRSGGSPSGTPPLVSPSVHGFWTPSSSGEGVWGSSRGIHRSLMHGEGLSGV